LIKFLFVFAVAEMAFTATVDAQICSNQTLKGSFGYTVTGTITQSVPPLVAGPFVAVGRIVFDGAGGVTTIRSLNDDGNPLRNDSGNGSYSLNSDCTGSFSISVGPSGHQIVLNVDIVLDDSYELRGVVTTPDVVLAFQGRRQYPVKY
jgi:hypothetical protein